MKYYLKCHVSVEGESLLQTLYIQDIDILFLLIPSFVFCQ